MVTENLNIELNKSLRLINYRRDLILSEQVVADYDLGGREMISNPNSGSTGTSYQVTWGPTEFHHWTDSQKPTGGPDIHDVLDIIAIGALFVPGGFLVSIAAELANVGIYAYEGDTWEVGFRLIFLGLPLAALVKKIPAVKQLGEKGTKLFVDKVLRGSKNFSEAEWKVLQEFKKLPKNEISHLTRQAARWGLRKSFVKLFTETSIYGFVRFIQLMRKAFPKIYQGTTAVVFLGGTWWTYDQLMAKFGIYPRGVMTEKQKSTDVSQMEQDFEKYKPQIMTEEENKIQKVMEQANSESAQQQAADALEQLKNKRKITTN